LKRIAFTLPVDDLFTLIPKSNSMKTLHCADAGFNCTGVIKGSSEEEILQQATQHAREVHQVEVTPEMASQLRTLIREEKEESKV
jgi:predicted small metal-binding protein